MSPGTPSTPGSRRDASSSTTHRTRTTGSTSGRPAAVSGSRSPATTLVDTDDTRILFETALGPKLYVDPALVRTDLLQRSETTSYCNYKGHATWWSAVVDGTVVEDVAWTYEDPLPESIAIEGFFSFDPEVAHVDAELPDGAAGADCGGECALPTRPA